MVNYGNVTLLDYQEITGNFSLKNLQYFGGVWSTKSTVTTIADNSIQSGE